MKLKAVLFDLDGTLLDTAPDFITVLNQLLLEEGREKLPEHSIRRTVSNGARALITLGFGLQEGEAGFERLKGRLLELYRKGLAKDTVPFPGITALIKGLQERGVTWGVVTNKPSVYTTPLLQAIDITPGPHAVVCPDHVTRTKPDPEPLFLACKKLGCDFSEVVYVGDHVRDIEAGRRAGMKTFAAAYGYIPEGDCPSKWNADFTVQHASEILPILESNFELII